jgi:signal transduction histidine kinase/ActR/RegA family two-component response regulator
MPEREADGGTLWHGSVTDITAAKQTQSELREMTERFQFAAQAGGVGTWDWDIGSGRLIWDDQMYRVYGLSREARTESFAKWCASKHPEDKARCDLEIKLALQGEKPFDTQFRIVRPDGATRVIRAIASVQRDTAGKPVRMIGTNWDVTAETEAAETLRRAQRAAEAAHEAQHEIAERLKKIASRVPGMIYQYRQRPDGSSCFPYASEGIRNIYNVSPEDVREDASPVFATLHPDDVPGVVDSIRRSHETLTEWRHEYRVRRPDGSERWLLGNSIPEREADGGTLWHGSITDMTAKKESELALGYANRELNAARIAAEAASRAKSAFLANMSHEIRTPLTAILGFADLLRDDGNIAAAPEQRVQAIDTIRSAGTHLLTLINDILDLSKIEADKMTVERIEMSPLTVLSEVRELLNPKARGKGIGLRLNLASPAPERMMGDPTRLRQVLMNLVGNAVKFTEAGTVTIVVGTEQRGAACRLVIDVEDTGPGMDPAQTGQLFQPFGQADDSVTRRFGGTGLGLTVSRRLAALMGGDVSLIRTELGRGSCFRLTLPVEAASTCRMVSTLQDAEQPTVPAHVAIALTGHILLVEDGPDNQRLIAFHLRKAGATVDIAEHGQVALERLESAAAANKPYDLVLTDMQMPVMDGYTLASAIRRRGSAVPIVALTAHAMAEDRERCIAAGCDDFATKPIDRVALLKTCKRWLDTSGAEGARSQAA